MKWLNSKAHLKNKGDVYKTLICSLIGTKAEKKFLERKVAGNADLQKKIVQ